MGDVEPPVWKCPFCSDVEYGGQPGKSNLTKHVKHKHPDKFKEYKKMMKKKIPEIPPLPGTRIVDSQPMSESKENDDMEDTIKKMFEDLKKEKDEWRREREHYQQQLKQVQQQPTQPTQGTEPTAGPVVQTEFVTTPPLPSFVDELAPADFIKAFLEHYQCKPLFIQMMIDSVHQSGYPPDAATVIQALKNMESGHDKKPLQCEWIGQMYAKRLDQYWKRQQELKNLKHRTAQPPVQIHYDAYGNPYQVQSNPPYPQNPQSFPQIPQYQGSQYNTLMAEIKKLTDEREKMRDKEFQDLKNKLEQQRAVDPAMVQMQEQMRALTEENKRLAQERIDLKEQATREEIGQIKQLLQSQLRQEDIQMLIEKGIINERDRYTATELRDEMNKRLSELAQQKGTTQLDVELRKSEHQLEMEKMKMESEKEKAAGYIEAAKEIAQIGGEALGRGITASGNKPQMGQQPPQGPVEQMSGEQIICPSCGVQLMLPMGVTDATCSRCKARFTVGSDGIPQMKGQMPLPMQKPEREKPKDEEPQGITPPIPKSQANFTVESQMPPDYNDKPQFPDTSEIKHTPVAREPPPRKQPGLSDKPQTPQQTNPPSPQTTPPPNADLLGNCAKCGKPVYDTNIGRTDKGKVYHRECA